MSLAEKLWILETVNVFRFQLNIVNSKIRKSKIETSCLPEAVKFITFQMKRNEIPGKSELTGTLS